VSPRPAIDHIRKPQILRAAAEVITEKGLNATRIADVAARAGTSAPAVLYWFESRERLLSEALIADEIDFAERLEERLETTPTAAGKLRLLIEESSRDGDLSLWIELWARSLHDPASAAERQRLDDLWRAQIAGIVAAGQEEGEFSDAVEPADVAVRLAALIDGFAVQVTLGDRDVDAERMAASCIELAELMLGAGLLTASSGEAA
jgi:AcrR family transcriptional regulator